MRTKYLYLTLVLFFFIINNQAATTSPNICATISYCKNCAYNSLACQQCFQNYGLNADNSVCQPCTKLIPKCKICTSVSECSLCVQGYYFFRGQSCQPCLSNCARCSSNYTCEICDPGYLKTINSTTGADQCLKQCPNKCISCNSSTSCNKCQNSYYLNSKLDCKLCSQTILYCQVCDTYGELCSICSKGYVLSNIQTINGTPFGSLCIQSSSQIVPTSLAITLDHISSTGSNFRGTDISFFLIFYVLFGIIIFILLIILIRLICIDCVRWRRNGEVEEQNEQNKQS